MIRLCTESDIDAINRIINDAAAVYKGVIPEDRWKEPYMPEDELRHEIGDGVVFWGYEENGELIGVMGIQHIKDVTLIRHAYVRADKQKSGVGGNLLKFLLGMTDRPVLMGTWGAAYWAIRFYEKHGFRLVQPVVKNLLLREYWSIPERQVEISVVLADDKWFNDYIRKH